MHRVNAWVEGLLGDVITLQRGFDITKKDQHPGPYPVISSSGPSSHHDEFKVSGPGVVIGRKGSLGGVYFADGSFWPHDTTLWVKDFKGSDPRFVFYLLQTLGLEKFDVGASNPTLNRNHLHLLPVAVPERNTQQRIAAVLSAYDDLIENNTRRIQILEEMAQAIYREWFVGFRYPGHEDVPLVDSKLGLIPEGWEVRPFGDLARLNRKNVDPRKHQDEEFAHFSLPAYDASHRPVIEIGEEIGSLKFEVTETCILYSKLNPRIPRVWFVDPQLERRSIASTEFLVLTPIEPWNLSVLLATCRSREFASRVVGMAGGTSTSHQRAKPGDLLRLPMLRPRPELTSSFDFLVCPIIDLAEHLRSANANLRSTRDLLLPRLISGKIDISELDIDFGESAA
jgi:type I restriction enzyme S subunit